MHCEYLDLHAANNHSGLDDIQSDYRWFQSRPLATEMVCSRKQGVGGYLRKFSLLANIQLIAYSIVSTSTPSEPSSAYHH